MPAIVKSIENVSLTCKKCQGKLWNNDSATRQAQVRAKYGSELPNDCVDSELDGHKCPYHK